MEYNHIKTFIGLLKCPSCEGELKQICIKKLRCSICRKDFKVHNNNIIKLFTSKNIYPTKDKIKWKNIYE